MRPSLLLDIPLFTPWSAERSSPSGLGEPPSPLFVRRFRSDVWRQFVTVTTAPSPPLRPPHHCAFLTTAPPSPPHLPHPRAFPIPAPSPSPRLPHRGREFCPSLEKIPPSAAVLRNVPPSLSSPSVSSPSVSSPSASSLPVSSLPGVVRNRRPLASGQGRRKATARKLGLRSMTSGLATPVMWNRAVNAVDLGGFPLEGDGTTRRGRLYRSGQAEHLTDEGWRQAIAEGLWLVVDLRNPSEIDRDAQHPPIDRSPWPVSRRSICPPKIRMTRSSVVSAARCSTARRPMPTISCFFPRKLQQSSARW